MLESKEHVYPSCYPQESNTISILACKNYSCTSKDGCCATCSNMKAVIFHAPSCEGETCPPLHCMWCTTESASMSVKLEYGGAETKKREEKTVTASAVLECLPLFITNENSPQARHWRFNSQHRMKLSHFLQLSHWLSMPLKQKSQEEHWGAQQQHQQHCWKVLQQMSLEKMTSVMHRRTEDHKKKLMTKGHFPSPALWVL